IGLGEGIIEGAALVLVDVAHRTSRRGTTRVKSFVDTQGPRGFDSLEEVADAVAAYQTNRARPDDISGLAKNLRIGEDGRYYWHWDPDYRAGRDGQDPKQKYERLVHCTRSLRCPALIIRGGSSDVLPEFAAAEFCELSSCAEYVNVAGAHHMIAGDRNDAFTKALQDFLLQRFPPL
ncbi:alpha/beta hydrolase, partial [Myxococcota bacterium]|nr:alpha/beta hydrolase [Myxococcota bacterium]